MFMCWALFWMALFPIPLQLVWFIIWRLSSNLITLSSVLVSFSIFSYSLSSPVCLLFSLCSPQRASINHGLTHLILRLSGIFEGTESERRTKFQLRLPNEELVWPTSILWRSLSLITSTYTRALILFLQCSVAKHRTQPETHWRRFFFLNVSKNLICPLTHLLLSDRPGSTAVVAMLFYPTIILWKCAISVKLTK